MSGFDVDQVRKKERYLRHEGSALPRPRREVQGFEIPTAIFCLLCICPAGHQVIRLLTDVDLTAFGWQYIGFTWSCDCHFRRSCLLSVPLLIGLPEAVTSAVSNELKLWGQELDYYKRKAITSAQVAVLCVSKDLDQFSARQLDVSRPVCRNCCQTNRGMPHSSLRSWSPSSRTLQSFCWTSRCSWPPTAPCSRHLLAGMLSALGWSEMRCCCASSRTSGGRCYNLNSASSRSKTTTAAGGALPEIDCPNLQGCQRMWELYPRSAAERQVPLHASIAAWTRCTPACSHNLRACWLAAAAAYGCLCTPPACSRE